MPHILNPFGDNAFGYGGLNVDGDMDPHEPLDFAHTFESNFGCALQAQNFRVGPVESVARPGVSTAQGLYASQNEVDESKYSANNEALPPSPSSSVSSPSDPQESFLDFKTAVPELSSLDNSSELLFSAPTEFNPQPESKSLMIPPVKIDVDVPMPAAPSPLEKSSEIKNMTPIAAIAAATAPVAIQAPASTVAAEIVAIATEAISAAPVAIQTPSAVPAPAPTPAPAPAKAKKAKASHKRRSRSPTPEPESASESEPEEEDDDEEYEEEHAPKKAKHELKTKAAANFSGFEDASSMLVSIPFPFPLFRNEKKAKSGPNVVVCGVYTRAERAKKIEHYREKKARAPEIQKKNKVMYQCRKSFADARPRVGGRFVSIPSGLYAASKKAQGGKE